uniref:NADH dehydrogenase [ubiquinone] iron-sulfur protein 4, mitochondrial n=1 Tax=Panagrolaimus sp. PS1159 TaxID=55785 RepID=A0AC35GQP6_9BILA
MIRTLSQMRVATRCFASDKHPVIRQNQAVRKPLEDILGETKEKFPVEVPADPGREVADLSGVPDEHKEERVARIFRPSRESPQTAWNNTKVWKIELDNRQRWENPLMGWASSGDPLSNIAGNLDFASKEDAIAFCQKNRWNYDVEEVHERKIIPKQYGTNFSWNKRTRISTK